MTENEIPTNSEAPKLVSGEWATAAGLTDDWVDAKWPDHVWDTNGVCQVHGSYCSMSPERGPLTGFEPNPWDSLA